ncbi:hypothetical protein [Paracoccus salsus]|uniref:hypothetical protein n=1 Tax=Paracoccus salsus TaxID=2911061 RepID=UPI001F3E3570|nr:hypothetical protein [Paracoccus salsus]MCF3972456.1 hypothetical protein [Paracoccus salsus]
MRTLLPLILILFVALGGWWWWSASHQVPDVPQADRQQSDLTTPDTAAGEAAGIAGITARETQATADAVSETVARVPGGKPVPADEVGDAADAAADAAAIAADAAAEAVRASQDARVPSAGAAATEAEAAAEAAIAAAARAADAAADAATGTIAEQDAAAETADAAEDAAEATARAADATAAAAQIEALLTPEGFDAAQVTRIINDAQISEPQKATLRRLVETAATNPELLRAALDQVKAVMK